MNKLPALFILLLISCNQTLENEKDQKVPAKDSVEESVIILKKEIGDTMLAAGEAPLSLSDSILQGRHSLTLQWLSFNNGAPGIAFINKADSGWYSIKGEQQNKEGYLKIEGKIKMITPEELIFDGRIVHNLATINNGELCEKNGIQTFLSTRNRKYWRLQNMEGCAGLTDYVDIYFKGY